jgi:hypothetical protein
MAGRGLHSTRACQSRVAQGVGQHLGVKAGHALRRHRHRQQPRAVGIVDKDALAPVAPQVDVV